MTTLKRYTLSYVEETTDADNKHSYHGIAEFVKADDAAREIERLETQIGDMERVNNDVRYEMKRLEARVRELEAEAAADTKAQVLQGQVHTLAARVRELMGTLDRTNDYLAEQIKQVNFLEERLMRETTHVGRLSAECTLTYGELSKIKIKLTEVEQERDRLAEKVRELEQRLSVYLKRGGE